jgi:hypothetical protein
VFSLDEHKYIFIRRAICSGSNYHIYMDQEKMYRSGRDISTAGIGRRQILTAGGLLAMGSLSGCLDRFAGATTNTGASPAAPFAGFGQYTGPSPSGDPTVYKLTPTLSSNLGDVKLEAWVTAQAIAANCCFDYNSENSQSNRTNYMNSRSNRATIRGPGVPDSDADGLGDSVEIRSSALELEQQLLSQTAAVASISKRSARTGRNPETNKPIKEHFDEMMATIDEIQARLEGCSDDVCVTVRQHADARWSLTQQAAKHFENGEWTHAAETVEKVQAIVEGDIGLLESSLKITPSEQEISNARLQELTGASDDDIAALYEFLAGEPVISEQFTITVPDARLPGSDSALVDELTPRRLVKYVTGRADDNGKLYAWGDNNVAKDGGGNNTNPIYEGEAVGGENALNRDSIMNSGDDEGSPLYKPDVFSSYTSGPVDTGIHLEILAEAGRTSVLSVTEPPQAQERTPAITVSADGDAVSRAGFDDWEVLDQPNAAAPALVCPIMVAPPDCPSPFPALLYVRRLKHDAQYIYTGGWIIDDGFLYENSTALLAVGGPTEVIGVGAGDLNGDRYGDVMALRLAGDRERRGSRLFDGTLSDAVGEGVLSEAEGDRVVRKKPGRTARQDAATDDGVPVVMTQQGRLVHFTGSNASDEVKFKAGAELSKSVN